eukprot:6476104-Amphidinium_carterae.1
MEGTRSGRSPRSPPTTVRQKSRSGRTLLQMRLASGPRSGRVDLALTKGERSLHSWTVNDRRCTECCRPLRRMRTQIWASLHHEAR